MKILINAFLLPGLALSGLSWFMTFSDAGHNGWSRFFMSQFSVWIVSIAAWFYAGYYVYTMYLT